MFRNRVKLFNLIKLLKHLTAVHCPSSDGWSYYFIFKVNEEENCYYLSYYNYFNPPSEIRLTNNVIKFIKHYMGEVTNVLVRGTTAEDGSSLTPGMHSFSSWATGATKTKVLTVRSVAMIPENLSCPNYLTVVNTSSSNPDLFQRFMLKCDL